MNANVLDAPKYTHLRCIVTITGIDEASAERILRNDLDLSEVKYMNLYIESYDDKEGIIARFDYAKTEKPSVIRFYTHYLNQSWRNNHFTMKIDMVKLNLRMEEIK